jgi:predicted RND superfamily exporter protein
VLVLASVERARHLEFSRSIDAMFDRSDPAIEPYARMARTFDGSELVLAAYDDPQLFTPEGLVKLGELTKRLRSLPGVAATTSLATTPLGSRIIDIATSPAARRIVRLMEGYVVGADHRTAAVVCTLEPLDAAIATERDKAVSRAGTIDAMRAIMREFPSGTVAGEPAMLRDGFAMLEWDGTVLAWASVALTGSVLLFFFRSLRWVIVPMGVVLTALWTTRGLLSIAGLKLTMVSTMLSAMITVVSIATVTHVIVAYRLQRDAGHPPADALRRALAILMAPICGAILTDIVGFGSLIASRVGPVHDFGVMTAIGAGMVLVAVAMVLPWVALTGRFDADPGRVWGETTLELGLERLVHWLVLHPRPILLCITCLVTIAAVGMTRLEVETDFTRNFRPDSPTVSAYDMVESRLGGAGVWDVLVPTSEPIDASMLVRLSRFEERLRLIEGSDAKPALTKVMSAADVIDAISPVSLESLEGSTLGTWALSQALSLMKHREPELTGALIGKDPVDGSHWLRVMLRAHERQPAAAKRDIIAAVRRAAAEEFPPTNSTPGAEVTGFFVLLATLVERLLADQWLTFAIAAFGIFVILSIAFRSMLLGAVALLPNGLPIFVVLGLLGWTGIRMNMGTAMIAAVSLGLSVDSSIHYIASFRHQVLMGRADAVVGPALHAAHRTAGRAMIFSTVALAVGFLALTTSGFMPTVAFGWLSCLTLIGGLLGNLVLLPVLLTLLWPWLTRGCSSAADQVQLSTTTETHS